MKLSTTVFSFFTALFVVFMTLALSPRSPDQEQKGRTANQQLVQVVPKSFPRKVKFTVKRIGIMKSHDSGYSVWEIIRRFAPVSFWLNFQAVILGWLLGLIWGSLAGYQTAQGWKSAGKFLFVAAIFVIVIPAPVIVVIFRGLSLAVGFSIENKILPVINLALLGAAPIALHHGVLVAQGLKAPDMVFSRTVGLPKKLQWINLMWPKVQGYWLSKLALLLVIMLEGPVLIEHAYNIHGMGDVMLNAALNSDRAVVFWVLSLVAILVLLGTFWTSKLESKQPFSS